MASKAIGNGPKKVEAKGKDKKTEEKKETVSKTVKK